MWNSEWGMGNKQDEPQRREARKEDPFYMNISASSATLW
jgi:hypothetical protein